MSACRAPRRLANRRRATVPAIAAAAAALTLSACGSGLSGGSPETKFVQGKGGVETVAKSDRSHGPKLDGKTLAGEKLDVSSFKGKIVVLNVWNSTCSPCRAEAPNLAKVAKETKRDVQFVGINTREPNQANAIKFEKEFSVGYPSFYDRMGELTLRFPKGSLNPQAIPTTIVLDRDGNIAARALKALSEESLRDMLDPLIAEK
ncbi:TlpA disulfide reductase family protein [Streptomyces sp. XD-27]|uniref:TlpA family protein disulfide reductase n=1 Tax=Streptomyces sp. XD-27 TaxID=3062779 RepID=UPI0026F46E0E|nr:TlpA disulfide reductase family protein [Streptomyces sp. XD-27]WKX71888.1 TlpA disulfide reductase family protein [Streptomyces sp. XD-27]